MQETHDSRVYKQNNQHQQKMKDNLMKEAKISSEVKYINLS